MSHINVKGAEQMALIHWITLTNANQLPVKHSLPFILIISVIS